MLAAILCREMGWTWEEYENQPSWFIDTIATMLKAEGEEIKRRAKQAD
ncbi:MAG: hypothetical protein HY456_00140 [Parcubacteria group bacterium]|nr:hypothetical protein [Parcubacteria group bacterium]